jgi:predicted MPP superfamily phosphohydrolase
MKRPAHRPPAGEGITDKEFVDAWFTAECNATKASVLLNIEVRSLYKRRAKMQAKGIDLPSFSQNPGYSRAKWHISRNIDVHIDDGVVLIGSDAHVWPGEPSPAWKAFCEVAHAIKPEIIVLNGDMIDGARISRHDRSPGNTPSLAEEIKAVREWIAMLPTGCEQYWTMGNHDARVDNYLAVNAPEMLDYTGSLTDRFSDWAFSWQLTINDTVAIRHRFRSGVHAAWNNALYAGISTVTGHTHQLDCKSVVDLRGTRYGIECGMLNDPYGPQFQYHEGAPSRARSGFAVLTFSDGTLRPPELAEWTGGAIWFRGTKWGVKQRSQEPG